MKYNRCIFLDKKENCEILKKTACEKCAFYKNVNLYQKMINPNYKKEKKLRKATLEYEVIIRYE